MNNINNFSDELLWIIFETLSQRDLIEGLGVNRFWYASIMQFRVRQAKIEFTSSSQLKRFIDTANVSITFDLCKIIFRFPIDNHIRSVSTLIRLSPRLQQIIMENDDNPYPFSIIKIRTPVSFNHVTFWYKNSFIIKINAENANRRRLKTLDYSLGSHLSSNSSIRLQPIGIMRSRLAGDSNQVVIDYYSKILLMPTFNHLISLRIALREYEYYSKSCEYEMDEKRLQSINQSCPKLESLYLFDYFLNISDECNDVRLPDNSINVMQILKSFGMTGAFFDVRCCSLLNLMYPHLESFECIYSYTRVNGYDSRYLQYAFCDMIAQFTSLKQLSLRSLSYSKNEFKYWPDYSFIEFLNNYPDRINSLDYPDCLFFIASNSTNDCLPCNNSNIISNGLFLQRLSSLAMRSEQLVEMVVNYLLYDNNNKLTISESIKELKIYDDKCTDNNGLYLLDWFVLFSVLATLKIENQVLVGSDNPDGNDDDVSTNYYLKNGSNKVLHQLIDIRKQKDDMDYKKNGLDKLETLELNHVKIRYINGLTSLFVNFKKLNRLILKHIHYSHIEWKGTGGLPETITSIYLNISYLRLDYILVTDIRIHGWNNNAYYLEKLVKKIELIEYSTGKMSDCFCELPSSGSNEYYRALFRCYPNSTFTFKLFCNHVDRFIFY
ncbi:unnamed protein product [Cunninghamella blakesleeana]